MSGPQQRIPIGYEAGVPPHPRRVQSPTRSWFSNFADYAELSYGNTTKAFPSFRYGNTSSGSDGAVLSTHRWYELCHYLLILNLVVASFLWEYVCGSELELALRSKILTIRILFANLSIYSYMRVFFSLWALRRSGKLSRLFSPSHVESGYSGQHSFEVLRLMLTLFHPQRRMRYDDEEWCCSIFRTAFALRDWENHDMYYRRWLIFLIHNQGCQVRMKSRSWAILTEVFLSLPILSDNCRYCVLKHITTASFHILFGFRSEWSELVTKCKHYSWKHR
jgi:hypothetical protein